MSEDYNRILQELSDLKLRVANTHRNGTVHEVEGTKLRMVVGKDKNGKDILSPWLNTNSMRGGAREQRFFKKGQNLSVVCPGGDLAQGMITPYAPNKDFKTPEHADGSGQDEESYQLDDYRGKQTKEGTDNWLQDEEEKDKQGGQQQQGGQQAGGGGGQQQKQKGHVGGDKAKMKARMNKDGGHTLRVGKDSRVASHKQGSKIRMKNQWVVVTDKNIIFSKPPTIAKDPIPNDDK